MPIVIYYIRLYKLNMFNNCTLIGDHLYVFAGQGHAINNTDIFYNDLFKMKLDI